MAESPPSLEGELRPCWDPRREKCVPVLDEEGRPEEVTLVAALRDADNLLGISAPTPGETVALLEYLLAICYSYPEFPDGDDELRELVYGDGLLQDVAKWLDEEQLDAEWDLFHPTQPLGQNCLLSPYLDEHGVGPAQLVIEHAGDYNQFFDHHHLAHPTPLPAAAAFRAMLTQHAFGPSGRARISGKETLGPALTNLGAGRLSGRIRVVALGRTLRETLLINLAPVEGHPGTFNRTWTVSPQPRRGFRAKAQGRHVEGPADLHTVLGRSILLRPAVDDRGELVVDRVLLAAGEVLDPLPAHHMRDAVYEQARDGTRRPLRPSPSRALWCEAHALYAAVVEHRDTWDLYHRLAQLSDLRINLWAVGMIAKHTSVLTWVSDTFPFVPGREADLRHAAERGSGIAEYVAGCLSRAAYVAWTITYPNPKPADKQGQLARFDASPEHWAHAADPFHTLLERVTAAGEGEEDEVHAAVVEYAAELAHAARRFLRNRLDPLPADSRGHRARAQAARRLEVDFTDPAAPDELKEDPQ